jgi:glycosyltransferase involved in cell wall biosynthesis
MPERPLRILYHHRVAASDGMRVHIAEVVSALRARGNEVCVVGPGGASEAEHGAGEASRLEQTADRLRRLTPSVVFEVVELLYNVPAYLRLSAAAQAFKPDVLYERYNLFLLAGLGLRRRFKLPMLLEINSPLAAERRALGQLRLRRLGRVCEAALWRDADVVLPVTQVLADEVARVRVCGSQPQVIANGANLALRPNPLVAAAARSRLSLGPDALILGFVGFIRAWHGVGWALEALAELPENIHLVLVGDGPALSPLETRAAELKVGHRLHLTGRVPHHEVSSYMQAFDVALQTAAVNYASPLKLFEYMGLGRAMIAPDQPNLREVLTDGENALLFSPYDQASFRLALWRLCGDADLRRRLGAAARQTVEDRPFTWAGNAARIEALARSLLSPAVETGVETFAGGRHEAGRTG